MTNAQSETTPPPSILCGYANLDVGQVHYRMRAGVGTPIILLHQTASSSAMWERLMSASTLPNSLYAFDTPGFGASFEPDIVPDMNAYARWISQAAQHLSLSSYHIVGHHTGSCIALELASSFPDQVESLFLSGPTILSEDERKAFASKLGAPFKPNRSGAYLLLTWEYIRAGGANADMVLLHREMVDSLRAWKGRGHAYSAAWEQDFQAQFAATTCPVTVLAAKDDILHPYLERAQQLRPDAKSVTLDGGANFAPDLQAADFTAAVDQHISALRQR